VERTITLLRALDQEDVIGLPELLLADRDSAENRAPHPVFVNRASGACLLAASPVAT